jgi:hypothetical protein
VVGGSGVDEDGADERGGEACRPHEHETRQALGTTRPTHLCGACLVDREVLPLMPDRSRSAYAISSTCDHDTPGAPGSGKYGQMEGAANMLDDNV